MAVNMLENLGYLWKIVNDGLETIYFGDEKEINIENSKSSELNESIKQPTELPRMPDIYKFLAVVDSKRKEEFLANLKIEAEKKQAVAREAEKAKLKQYFSFKIEESKELKELKELEEIAQPNAILELIKNIPANMYALFVEPIMAAVELIINTFKSLFDSEKFDGQLVPYDDDFAKRQLNKDVSHEKRFVLR